LPSDIGDQFVCSTDGHHGGDSTFHFGVVQQQGFDFPEVNAVPADLDLVVSAAQVNDFAVAVNAAQVTGAINALTIELDEPVRCLFREVQISECHSWSTDTNLTDIAVRNLILLIVQYDNRVGRKGAADSDGPTGKQFTPRRSDRRFGRPVGV